jgi:hypothetical protein
MDDHGDVSKILPEDYDGSPLPKTEGRKGASHQK